MRNIVKKFFVQLYPFTPAFLMAGGYIWLGHEGVGEGSGGGMGGLILVGMVLGVVAAATLAMSIGALIVWFAKLFRWKRSRSAQVQEAYGAVPGAQHAERPSFPFVYVCVPPISFILAVLVVFVI